MLMRATTLLPALLFLAMVGCTPAEIAADEEPDTELSAAIDEAPDPQREFRAAWIATVANIDWPSEPGLPVREQQEELRALLDRADSLGMNAVIFQVRPATDAFYDSPYEPWSEYLTGTMGEAPEPYYDPLHFAIEESHARGLELHAWFNPYRALHPSSDSTISPDHVSQTQPEIVRDYGTHLWMDPGEPGAQELTLNVIMDVVERYDIDGVHFDDYFYPYGAYDEGADFPDDGSYARAVEQGETLSRADWRRQNVDNLMRDVYESIKEEQPHVQFGISPFGIWRPGYPDGTTGYDAYNELYADARKWLQEGWVDYFTPQLYYQLDQTDQPFAVMLRWWIEQNVHERHIWPGLYTSGISTDPQRGDWRASEITSQIFTTRSHPETSGHIHFSLRAFQQNPDSLNEAMMSGPYRKPAIRPSADWLAADAPQLPSVQQTAEKLQVRAASDDVRWWILRLKSGDEWELHVHPGTETEFPLDGEYDIAVVTAANRLGVESEAAAVALD